MPQIWTNERRELARKQAIQRWADPFYRANHGKSIQKAPKCPSCGETDIANFYVDEKGRRTNKHCRACHKEQCKERWHNRTWLDRWASRNYKYGVTKEFLVNLYEAQQGKCAICDQEPNGQRGLHVDHDHKTGKVRGLLCHGCNVALGSFKENVTTLNKAIEYLRSN